MNSLVKEGSIGSVLFNSRIINEEDLRAALEEQQTSGCRIGEALVKLGTVTQEDIDWALSNQLNIPYIRLNRDMIDKAAVDLVPAVLARKFNLIPVFRAGDEIGIALADPLNVSAIEAVEEATGCRVIVSMPIIRELREMQDIFYGPVEVDKDFGFTSTRFSPEILENINKDVSGASFLNYILLYFTRNKLASLSLQPLDDAVAITAKIGGSSREIGRLAVTYYPDLLRQIRKLGSLKVSSDVSAKGTLVFLYKGQKIYFRVLTLKAKAGDYVTLKMDFHAPFPVEIAELGLSADKLGSFRELLSAKKGIILFSSENREECCRIIDLYLDEFDTSGKTVMVLGDGTGRGEKRFPCISLHKSFPLEMESLTAAILEHDPDMLVIEDVFESRSFEAAARVAMRGRLAVCGICCSDLTGALGHLLNFQQNYSILNHMKGVVSIKGVNVLCPHCRQSYIPSSEEKNRLPATLPAAGYFAANGCTECGYTGYSGKKYLVEIISFSRETIEVIAMAKESTGVLQRLGSRGYQGIQEDAVELLNTGEISPEEFIAVVKH
jgi:type IV pilus assembly protein PilB